MVVIRRVPSPTAADRRLVSQLQWQCGLDTPLRGREIWLAWDGDTPVGFATLYVRRSGTAELSGGGVLADYRGRGIHDRLITARLAWAKRHGCRRAETYTLNCNHKSANNLIDRGFRLCNPERRMASGRVNYFERPLP